MEGENDEVYSPNSAEHGKQKDNTDEDNRN